MQSTSKTFCSKTTHLKDCEIKMELNEEIENEYETSVSETSISDHQQTISDLLNQHYAKEEQFEEYDLNSSDKKKKSSQHQKWSSKVFGAYFVESLTDKSRIICIKCKREYAKTSRNAAK